MGKSGGRPSKFSAEDLYEFLQYEDEPQTVANLAEAFETTRTTVRKRLDDLQRYPGVRTKQIGQTDLFWHSTSSAMDDRRAEPEDMLTRDVPDLEEIQDAMQRENYERRAKARGLWLAERETITSRRAWSCQTGMNSIYNRLDAFSAVTAYIRDIEVTWPRVLEDAFMAEHGEEIFEDEKNHPPADEFTSATEELLDIENWPITRESLDYYTKEVEVVVGGEAGRVSGFGEYRVHSSGTHEIVSEQLRRPEGEVDFDAVDDALPELEESIRAGDLFDDFACEMFDWGW